MNKHKWHKEIVAWANGAEIEQYSTHYQSKGWHEFDGTFCDDQEWEFRIKQQHKEPQYLYAYLNPNGIVNFNSEKIENDILCYEYIGKIKLEQDNE